MNIACNGDVQLCCFDADTECLDMNVRDRTVLDVWNSDELWSFRHKHKALDYSGLKLCDECDMPEQGYFSTATIMATPFFSAKTVRRLIPIYEKMLISFKGTGYLQ